MQLLRTFTVDDSDDLLSTFDMVIDAYRSRMFADFLVKVRHLLVCALNSSACQMTQSVY